MLNKLILATLTAYRTFKRDIAEILHVLNFALHQHSPKGAYPRLGAPTLGGRSIHCDILRQLNGEGGEDWILPLFHAISDHRAKRVLPLPGWER